MKKIELKKKFDEIFRILPNSKLNVVYEFAMFVKDKEESYNFIKSQVYSDAYKEWLSSNNDIYNEVFEEVRDQETQNQGFTDP